MNKLYYSIVLCFFLLLTGCSGDEVVTPPVTGEVLLAEVSGDSIGVASGLANRSNSITGLPIGLRARYRSISRNDIFRRMSGECRTSRSSITSSANSGRCCGSDTSSTRNVRSKSSPLRTTDPLSVRR